MDIVHHRSPCYKSPPFRFGKLAGNPLDNVHFLDKLPQFFWGVVVFSISLAVFYAVGRFVLEPLVERTLRIRSVNLTIRGAILRVVRAAVWFAGILLALDLAGIDVFGASATLAAALTIAVGFATRDIAANFVGGVFIVTDPRFNIGDWISWSGNEGIIEDITFRVTRVRTFDNELITVPNSVLTTNAVKNPVAGDMLRVQHVFPLAYGVDIDAVDAILLRKPCVTAISWTTRNRRCTSSI